MPDQKTTRTIALAELQDLKARALPRIRDVLERTPLAPEDELPITTTTSSLSGVIVT